METQTATQSQTQTKTENAKDRFIRKTRELFAKETDLDKRWNALRPILAELLADPDMIDASKKWPDCVPANGRAENLLFYEDPDYGFAINGLTKGQARQGAPRAFTITLISTRSTASSMAEKKSCATTARRPLETQLTPRSRNRRTCSAVPARSIWSSPMKSTPSSPSANAPWR